MLQHLETLIQKQYLSILFHQMSKFILSSFGFLLFVESRKYVVRIITF